MSKHLDLLTGPEVAEMLHVPHSTVRHWRQMGTGPAFVRLGPRRIMYERAAILEWFERQRALS